MPPERQGPPAVNRGAKSVVGGDFQSIPPTTDLLADLDALAESLAGYLVVQVVIDDAGHRRTNVYRSAGAAERAVKRARERGRTAHVTLVQMLPVGVVSGLAVVR